MDGPPTKLPEQREKLEGPTAMTSPGGHALTPASCAMDVAVKPAHANNMVGEAARQAAAGAFAGR